MIHIRLVTRKPVAKKFRIESYRKLARRHMRRDVVSKFMVLGKGR